MANLDALKKKLDGMLTLVGRARPDTRSTSCKGLSWDKILDRVEAAIDEADAGLCTAIMDFCDLAAATPRTQMQLVDGAWSNLPLRDDEGEIVYETHHFVRWLWGLQDGWFHLPPKLPRIVLEAFCSRYGWAGYRCEDCLLGLSNGIVPFPFSLCPVCGSHRISYQQLSVPGYVPKKTCFWEAAGGK